MHASGFSCGLVALALLGAGCGGDDGEGGSAQDGGANSGAQAGASASSKGKLDACKIVGEQDATALFGQPAKRDADELVVDPALLGQCQWTYEKEDEIGSVASQSLQFYVWDGAEYHSVPPDAEPLEVGEDGYVKASEALGVDTGWVQDGRAIALSYFSIGTGMPSNASKVSAMKALALEISARL